MNMLRVKDSRVITLILRTVMRKVNLKTIRKSLKLSLESTPNNKCSYSHWRWKWMKVDDLVLEIISNNQYMARTQYTGQLINKEYNVKRKLEDQQKRMIRRAMQHSPIYFWRGGDQTRCPIICLIGRVHYDDFCALIYCIYHWIVAFGQNCHLINYTGVTLLKASAFTNVSIKTSWPK